ncbi:MAG: hypothetical protein UR60_C0044G0010 [Candidatus Moranbacteria bacterium GW2011_GWF2_34_56]|nr:MAG: hypothetical protein UR51_C0022G0009 [Candidatus Moranbacteria bacterium GW2011_GWF1_34_10]KKP63436.1 MAG: hypothetical protein UR60_C0044G0010 [Candidatus Moranbacteria bacterium GW2011_GWF2_34_56]HBI17210.1 hypothetical protein [Candidatus Moranbacteria bacterium]
MINKKISTIAGSLIIVAIVAALGFSFLGLNKKEEMQNQNNVVLDNSDLGNKKEVKQENKNKEIEVNQNNQTKEINENINSQTNTNQSVQAQPIIESRIVGDGCYEIKDGHIDEYNLRKDFNLDPADITIRYENKQFGVSFDIPYNKKWGNKDCIVLPYVHWQRIDVDTKYLNINFGIFRAWTGGAYHFNTSKKRNAEDIIKEQSNNGSPNPSPRTKMIGKHQVVIYESYGMGTKTIYEVLGDKNNYEFKQSWIKDRKSDSESDSMEKIIETLEIK